MAPDQPVVTYDIGADGSVLKWWNTPQDPKFTDLAGSLYEFKETLLSTGDHNLVVEARSPEGIDSIEVIANDSTLVDEKTCEQDPGKPGIECQELINEWVTDTGSLSPGILNLEVIATDRLGHTGNIRFWVNIPYTPPPPPGQPEPPSFKDILSFREEHGLDLDLDPVKDELELNDRVFDLIGAWNNPHTPLGEVARTSWERWGVPLRPVDVAELEYRIMYEAQAATAIPTWAAANATTSFAGYRVDERAGGKIYVGFTSQQSTQLDALKASAGLIAPERVVAALGIPTHSLANLNSLQQQIITAAATNQPGLITGADVDVQANNVRVGASNVGQAIGFLQGIFGSTAPITVNYQPATMPLQSGRERSSGQIRAGDLIRLQDRPNGEVKPILIGSECTANFGAFDQAKIKGTDRTFKRMFLLSASHCMELGHEVLRRSDPDPTEDQKQWIGKVARNGLDYEDLSRDVDAVAIRLDNPDIVPRQIYAEPGLQIPITAIGAAPGIGVNVCYTGITSDRKRCGPIYAAPRYLEDPETGWTTWEACFREYTEGGDSGGPIWIEGTGTAVGMLTRGYEEWESPEPATCFEPLKPYPEMSLDSAIFSNSRMAPLHLVTSR